MNVRFWPALFAAAVLLTACSGGNSSSTNANCEKAPDSLVSAISDGFNDSTFELHDAQMVKVPKEDQNDRGYPGYVVAGNITGPGGADPSAVGVWAVSSSTDQPGPIFALNPGANQLTDWGDAIKDGSLAAKNRDIMAGLDAAKEAPDCL